MPRSYIFHQFNILKFPVFVYFALRCDPNTTMSDLLGGGGGGVQSCHMIWNPLELGTWLIYSYGVWLYGTVWLINISDIRS